MALGIDLPTRDDELPGRGKEGQRLARATAFGEVVPDLYPALEEVLLVEVRCKSRRHVGELAAYRRVSLLGWRKRRILRRRRFGLGGGSSRRRGYRRRRPQREVRSDDR